MVISDGAPGLIAAIEVTFPRALRQRCAVHRARNILAKVAARDVAEVKAAYWSILDDIDAAPGEPAIAVARARAAEFSLRYARQYPGAVACLEDDFASLTTHLRLPAAHWRRTRNTNFIERTFGETRRRVKVIGRLPGERSCVSLVWAVLDRAGRGWRGVTQTPAGLRLLQDLRRRLLDPPALAEEKEVVQAAA
jgi:putative transposase